MSQATGPEAGAHGGRDGRERSAASVGLGLPPVGLGCSPVRGPRVLDLRDAIAAALDCGYRLFDTAEAYGTESLLGELLGTAGGGDDALVISKLWQTNHRFADALASCEASLRRLRREAIDVYLVHSPEAWRHAGPLDVEPLPRTTAELASRAVPRRPDGGIDREDVILEETWSALVELRRRGLVRRIGIANASVADLERLRRTGDPVEAVQVELHPGRPCVEMVDYCGREGVALLAHTPFGGGGLLADPRLRDAARAAGCSPAALVLRWHRTLGVVPLPGTTDPSHLRENLAAAAAPALDEATRRALTALAPDRGVAAEEGR